MDNIIKVSYLYNGSFSTSFLFLSNDYNGTIMLVEKILHFV